jgi:hypothetical protein
LLPAFLGHKVQPSSLALGLFKQGPQDPAAVRENRKQQQQQHRQHQQQQKQQKQQHHHRHHQQQK